MPTKHTVQEGECVSSIAHDYGLLPNTVWEYEENRTLRELRKNPNVLLPGDVLVIPDKKQKQVDAETGKRHRFRRKGVPVRLRLQLVAFGVPRANLRYRLDIDGKIITATTDEKGRLEHWIPATTRKATLICGPDEEYDLAVGYLNPQTDEEGVYSRLRNLGFLEEGESDEEEEMSDEERLRAALEAFQGFYDLDITGEPDEQTREKLIEVHGS